MKPRTYRSDASAAARVRARALANAKAAQDQEGAQQPPHPTHALGLRWAHSTHSNAHRHSNPLLRWLPGLGMLVFQLSADLRIRALEPSQRGVLPLGEHLSAFLDIADQAHFDALRDWCERHPGQPREINARMRHDPRRQRRHGWISGMMSGRRLDGFTLTLLPATSARPKPLAADAQLRRIDALANASALAGGIGRAIAAPLSQAHTMLKSANLRLSEAGADGDALAQLRTVEVDVHDALLSSRQLGTMNNTIGAARPEPCDLAGILTATLALVASSIKRKAILVTRFEEVPRVCADPQQLSQLFTNLVVNALDAIPAGNPMANQLSLELFDCGHSVQFNISDSGRPIPEEELANAFEPFFRSTTGRSSCGLGLSICQGIVAELGGSITLASAADRGTTVSLSLPTCAA